MQNIHYETEEIAKFFSSNRVKWDDFYPSEKELFLRVGISERDSVLDVGCGCGGLGNALKEKFGVTDYTGVEINLPACNLGKIVNPKGKFIHGDICELTEHPDLRREFDKIFSLSCFDWNSDFDSMFSASWDKLKPGGTLFLTLRLVKNETTRNIETSFQYINYSNEMKGEVAPYVVFNASEIISKFINLNPSKIWGVGYFGSPSPTAVTPHNVICFSAMALNKKLTEDDAKVILELDFPEEILKTIKNS
ncbi:AdoMet_MTases domain containing protein [Candidatus Nanopelagicaceae bacterium]